MDHRVEAVGGKGGVHPLLQPADGPRQQVGQHRAEHVEGQKEDGQHHGDEDGDGGVFSGEHPVHLHAALVLPALTAADHRFPADPLDKIIAHIRQGGVAVHAVLLLHLEDGMLHQLQLVLVQRQSLPDGGVVLDELGGGKTHRQAGLFRMVLDLHRHRMDAPVHRAGAAEVGDGGAALLPHGLHRPVDQLLDALVFGGGDGDHRDAQQAFHLLHVDGAAVGPDLVHHVQSQHHGGLALDELQGQVQVALDVGGVHDVDDAVRLSLQQKLAGDDLLGGIGPDGIDARQVHHRAVLLPPDLAAFLVHGDAGEVAHVLIHAGELVEQGGLSAVLVSRKGEDHALSTSRS